MKIPLNRLVAFAGPYVAVISGALSDWLFVHLKFLGDFVEKTNATKLVSQGLVFGLTTVVVWLGQQKWLTGNQRFERAQVDAAIASAIQVPDTQAVPEYVEPPDPTRFENTTPSVPDPIAADADPDMGDALDEPAEPDINPDDDPMAEPAAMSEDTVPLSTIPTLVEPPAPVPAPGPQPELTPEQQRIAALEAQLRGLGAQPTS